MMHQAALLDGAALDALAPQQNRLHPAELDTSRGRVIQAFILSPMSIPEGPRRDIRAIRQNAGMTHFRPRHLVSFKMKIHLSLEAKHESGNVRRNIKPQRSKSALTAHLFGSIAKTNHPPRLTLGTKGTFLGCFD
jgi:hypothetical protein